jgi:Glycosyl transferase family 1
LSSIAYYITGHGFGHAVRSSQVVRSLKKVSPHCEIHVRTTAPEWLFPKAVRYSRQSVDTGLVQRDSLEMDLAATVQTCRQLHEDAPAIVEREVSFVRDHDVRLVVGDIPPLCFEIAARAGIPSVAVTNFTWDGIYSAYQTRYPEFAPLIDEIRQFYAKTTLALTLPYPCDMNLFSRQEPIPWIARVSRLEKDEARSRFSLPQSATVVLLSFGGLGLQRLPWDKFKKMRDYFFVTTADERKLDGNILILPNAQRHYENLVRAVDVVITKPGYGIVTDVIAHRVPALYTDRGEFPEYLKLVEALKHSAVAEFIPQTELLSGNIERPLERILNKTRDWPPVGLNGAQIAAEKILSLI